MPKVTETSNTESPRSADVMDGALELLAGTGPEYGGGLANHGPMAAEALVVLERLDAVLPWVERYRKSLDEHPSSRNPITQDRWPEAIGDFSRAGDWSVFFARQLDDLAWRAVLSEWCARLAPGISAAAFHGVIRTAHAARSLSRRDAPARRRELAEGLAYWAASYQSLSELPDPVAKRRLPSRAICDVELLPESGRRRGFITDRLLAVSESASFAKVADLADTSGDPSRFLSDLAETFAGIYLAHATRATMIALIHAVTGPSAIRLLLPHVDYTPARALLRYGWQAAAALYAASARVEPDQAPKLQPADRDDLIDRALATGDEHAFKFTEACLREHAVAPSPVFLAAALDVTKRLSSR